jgi:predicted DNA-binding protein with PD1-like motif
MRTNYCITLFMTALATQAAESPRLFAGAQIQEVYRVLLDRNALLLESITDVIRQKDIHDGQVFVTAGSVQECTYHYVTSTALKPVNAYKTFKGAAEILNAGGLIASGEPHLHITLSTPAQGAFGGHLENGCRILYLAEITIVKYSGTPLTRKNNVNGVSLLQAR